MTGVKNKVTMTNELIKAMESPEAFREYLNDTSEMDITSDIKAYAQPDRVKIATAALQGLCANYLREGVTGWSVKTYAVEAVELADALIAELNKRE
jgi:hypothetical protein